MSTILGIASTLAFIVLLGATAYIVIGFKHLEAFNYLQVIAFAVLAIGFVVASGIMAVVVEIEGLRRDLTNVRRPSSKVSSSASTK